MNHEILIGRCRIPENAEAEGLMRGLSLLSNVFHHEINRYHRVEDRLSRLCARLLLRKLFQSLGLSRESSLTNWYRDKNNRPFIRASGADFSISHAYPWVVVAVGTGCRVGIDIEVLQTLELNAFTPYFTKNELTQIRASLQPEVAALHFWSMREAILKADGRGLLAPEAEVRYINSLRSPAGDPWIIKNIDFSEGCLYLACDKDVSSATIKECEYMELLV